MPSVNLDRQTLSPTQQNSKPRDYVNLCMNHISTIYMHIYVHAVSVITEGRQQKFPFMWFQNLAREYGDVITMKLGKKSFCFKH